MSILLQAVRIPKPRRISTGKITLMATFGERISDAPETFDWGIDPDFKNLDLDVWGCKTSATSIGVFEIVRDGNIGTIFNDISWGLNRSFESLCLEQGEIIRFVQEQDRWLAPKFYATFFLFKVRGKFFVAIVVSNDYNKKQVYVATFPGEEIWVAAYGHRVVVPI